jgi:hypothetical protein
MSKRAGLFEKATFDVDGMTVVVDATDSVVFIDVFGRHDEEELLDMRLDFEGPNEDDGTMNCTFDMFVRDEAGFGVMEDEGDIVLGGWPHSFDDLLAEPEFKSVYDEAIADAQVQMASREAHVEASTRTADTHYDSPTVKHSIRECYVNGDEDSIIEIAASCIIDAWLDWSGSNEPILEDRNNISGVLFNALMEELVEENDGEVTDQIRALAEDDTQRFYADALEEAQQAWASVMGSLPQRFASRHVADAPISRTDLYSGDGVACHDADVRHISTWGYRTGDEYEVVYIDSCSDPLMQDKYVIVSGSDLMYDYRFDTADAAESFLSDQGFYWMDDKTAQYIPMGHVTLPRDESEWTLDRQGFDGSKHWTYFDGSNSYYIDTTVTTDTQAIGEGMSSAEYAAMSDEERKEFIDELIAETSYDGVVGYGSTVSVGYGQMQGASFEEGVGRLEEFVNDAIDQMNDDTEYQIQRHSIGRRKQAGVKGSDDVTCHDDDTDFNLEVSWDGDDVTMELYPMNAPLSGTVLFDGAIGDDDSIGELIEDVILGQDLTLYDDLEVKRAADDYDERYDD